MYKLVILLSIFLINPINAMDTKDDFDEEEAFARLCIRSQQSTIMPLTDKRKRKKGIEDDKKEDGPTSKRYKEKTEEAAPVKHKPIRKLKRKYIQDHNTKGENEISDFLEDSLQSHCSDLVSELLELKKQPKTEATSNRIIFIKAQLELAQFVLR